MNMMKVSTFGLLLLALVLVAGCAPGPNDLVNSPRGDGTVAGFWRGLWNGAIAPVTFIVSLFNPKVQMYDVHNNGNLYNLGYLLGGMIILGGGAGGAGSARRRR
jgi:hypothetical protein